MLAAFPRPSFPPTAFSAARRWASSRGRPLVGRYTDVVPTELARVQSGRNVRLRDYELQRANGRLNYDLKLQNGKVLPAEGPTFIGAWRSAPGWGVLTFAAGPNGCSLRPPLSPNQQEVVRNFGGRNVTIYLVKEGTPLPPTLQILHEHSDHYSMQCTKPMTLDQLNAELTKFFEAHARVLDKFQFDDEFPFSII